jgi:hypothetical protein
LILNHDIATVLTLDPVLRVYLHRQGESATIAKDRVLDEKVGEFCHDDKALREMGVGGDAVMI